jgi:hypothetical protein
MKRLTTRQVFELYGYSKKRQLRWRKLGYLRYRKLEIFGKTGRISYDPDELAEDIKKMEASIK